MARGTSTPSKGIEAAGDEAQLLAVCWRLGVLRRTVGDQWETRWNRQVGQDWDRAGLPVRKELFHNNLRN